MTSLRPDPDPCLLVLEGYDPAEERRRESLLGLGNGVLFARAAAPEAVADGTHYPGTYRAGLYDRLADIIEGERIEEESLVNLPNWLPLRFRAEGEAAWFSPDAAELLEYRHALDMERGVSTRELVFRDGRGRWTRLRERRLVSMARPEVAALRLEIAPLDWDGRVEVRSALDGSVANGNIGRYRPFDGRHLDVLDCAGVASDLLFLRARMRRSRVEVAVAARTRAGEGDAAARDVRLDAPGAIAEHLLRAVSCGRALAVEKIAAIVTSRAPAILEAGEAALASARGAPGFAALEEEHALAWRRLWRRARVDADRPELARAVRLHAFHILQTASPCTAEHDAGFPARGWQEAYRGHVFWDEILAFPFLDLRFPEVARALLLHRHRRLRAAKDEARRRGPRGAMFPWRSASDGREVTPKLQLNPYSGGWMRDPTRLQRHVGAAIARNVWHHALCTGDKDFLAGPGGELLAEIARFWASLARFDPALGRWRIRGVIGPDEYHNAYPGAAEPGLDDNAYTNVMAAWTLERARDALDRLPPRRRTEFREDLGLDDAELALWDRVARGLRVPFLDDGVIEQFDGFDRLRPADPEEMRARHDGRRLDWALAAEGDTADAYQVTKQADVLMLLHLLPGEELAGTLARMGYEVAGAQLRRTADYYLARISHESSLSRVACAGALSRLDPEASWRFFREALCTDLDPAHAASTAEGLHLGSMAGTLDVLQRHYLGVCPGEDGLRLDPAPPPGLGPVRLALRVRGGDYALNWDGAVLRLDADAGNAAPLTVSRRGEARTLRPGASIVVRPGEAEADGPVRSVAE